MCHRPFTLGWLPQNPLYVETRICQLPKEIYMNFGPYLSKRFCTWIALICRSGICLWISRAKDIKFSNLISMHSFNAQGWSLKVWKFERAATHTHCAMASVLPLSRNCLPPPSRGGAKVHAAYMTLRHQRIRHADWTTRIVFKARASFSRHNRGSFRRRWWSLTAHISV